MTSSAREGAQSVEPAVAGHCRMREGTSTSVRGLLEHLAVLRHIAADVFEAAGLPHAADAATSRRMTTPDAVDSGRACTLPAQRLLRHVDKWLLELAMGEFQSCGPWSMLACRSHAREVSCQWPWQHGGHGVPCRSNNQHVVVLLSWPTGTLCQARCLLDAVLLFGLFLHLKCCPGSL